MEEKPKFNPIFISYYAFDEALERGEGSAVDEYVTNAVNFDFDSEDDPDKARKDAVSLLRKLQVIYDVSPDACGIYFSGKKGFHIVVPIHFFTGEFLSRVKPITLKAVTMELAGGFPTLDESVWDHRRIFRIPGAGNSASRRKIQLTFDELEHTELAVIKNHALLYSGRDPSFVVEQPAISRQLMDLFSETSNSPRETFSERRERVARTSAAVFVESSLSNMFKPAPIGMRNNACATLAGLLVKKLDDLVLITEVLKMWNRTNPDPLHDVEVIAVARSIFLTHTAKEQHDTRTVSGLSGPRERPGTNQPTADPTGTANLVPYPAGWPDGAVGPATVIPAACDESIDESGTGTTAPRYVNNLLVRQLDAF